MSSSLLEKTRSLHENFERYELLIENEMKTEPKTTKERVLQSHRVNHYLNSSVECSKSLINIYTDSDQSRKDELTSISGFGTDLYSSFYEKLREIKDYHRKFPNLKEGRNNDPLIYNPSISFTGNEMNGKFLDLNEHYEEYINLSFNRNKSMSLDYLTFLTTYYKFQYNDINRMKYPQYKDYLQSVYKYLVHFIERTQPLFELQSSITKSENEFNQKWDNNEFDPTENNNNNVNSNDNNNNNEDDKLFCKACKKLFTSENVFNGHLKGKKHIQNEEKMVNSNGSGGKNENNNEKWYNKLKSRKDNTMLEYKINRLSEYLSDQIESTKENVLKKQSRSYTEVADGVTVGGDGDEDEDDEVNIDDLDVDVEVSKLKIANYPVDWSGKPIPYWVYRYLELGVEYKCEICGNQSYWGRKAYEKHFQETRHSYGMSSIGVPNTTHFHEITKIKDALELWTKIKNQTNQQQFKSDRDEEYEDETGNVMSKKNYDLLVKQDSFIECEIQYSERQGLYEICLSYNITTDVNFDYCSVPQFIRCDPYNLTVTYMNLIGDENSKTLFPNGTIGKLDGLFELIISNSILINFFEQITINLQKLTLNNSIINPNFPQSTSYINYFKLYDTQFTGNINSELLFRYVVFELIYTNSNLMSYYNFTDSEGEFPFLCQNHTITINNFFIQNGFYKSCNKITFILGKFFENFNFSRISPYSGAQFTIQESGHYNKPVLIDSLYSIPVESIFVYLTNIRFNFTNSGYLNFTKKSLSFVVTNSSIVDSLGNIKIGYKSFSNVAFSGLNLTKLPDLLNFDSIDLSNNKISGSLPELPSPESSIITSIDLRNNNFTGSIPQSYCYHFFDLSNNQLSGDLPMCFICSLNNLFIRDQIKGNNFSNYHSDQTNAFPKCSNITFTSSAIANSILSGNVTGTNFGWPNPNNTFDIFSTPNCQLSIKVPNYRLSSSITYYTIEYLKKFNFTSNVLFSLPNINVTLSLSLIPPTITYASSSFIGGQSELIFSLMGTGYVHTSMNEKVDLMLVYVDNFNCNVTSVTSFLIYCTISTRFFEIKNYTILILNSYTGLSSSTQYIYQPTIGVTIGSIISPPRTGGIVSIYGSFITNFTDLSITIGNNSCPILFINSSYITCLVPFGQGPLDMKFNYTSEVVYEFENLFNYQDDPSQCLNLSQCNYQNGGGVCNQKTGKCECSNYYKGIDCSTISHFVSSISSTTIDGGNASFIGWFGNNHFNLNVMIGKKNCYPIYFSNSTTITCLAPPGSGLNSIQITQNLIDYSLPNSYQYKPIKRKCPNDCTSIINGHCNQDSGYCDCFTNWYGYDCSIFTVNNSSSSTNTSIDPKTGITNITNEYTQFQISVLKIIEIDINGLQVYEYLLNDNWIFSKNNNNNPNIFTFIQSIQNNTCNITYIVEEVQEKKNITFAGIEYTLDDGSIKMTISIENYSYKSNLNILQLQMKSSTVENPFSNTNEHCNNVEIENQKDQDNSLNYITIKKDDKLLSGRFINKVESDGRSTIITTKVISKEKDSIIVGMNLPHCAIKCLIDPDFSLIISPNFESDCSNSNKKPWLIPVAVVVPVAGVAIIISLEQSNNLSAMSGFIKDLSSAQSDNLNLFKEYLNKKETIEQIKSDIKNKLSSIASSSTSTTTTTTTSENEESSSSTTNKEELIIWNISLEKDSKERDIILLKFLRAREFKIENSKQMLIDSLVWRKQNHIDSEIIVNEVFPDYYKNIGTIYKTDKDGRPVMINHYHAIDPDVIFKDGVDQFVRWKVQQMEIAIRDTLIPSQWEIEDLIVIHDYKDCSFFRMDPRIKQASNQTIQTLQNNYPEFLARKFFINIPWLMEKLFSIFTVFTSERTKSKFIICSGNYREKLLKYIEADSIAPKLSGFEDNQSPIINIKINPQKSHSIQLGKLDADKTIEWEFCTNEIDSEIGGKILIESNNQSSTSDDILYFYNNNNNNNINNNNYSGSPTSTSNDPFNCFLSIEPKEFNSGSIQIEDDSFYTFIFNNHLTKQCDLFYRITIKSKTTHSSTTSSYENLGK
ncbi:hypothetical protein RB653_006798 [Dictyostelium firmibasis]|uniref:CRAL-TRIO domain-containing protein n=1 Tax=Dictyostelium firmibasis TaxID=79012 RepID=A0AAN7TV64_9MYCE